MLKVEVNNKQLMITGENINLTLSKLETSNVVEVRINKESDEDSLYIYKLTEEVIIVSGKGYVLTSTQGNCAIQNTQGELVTTLSLPSELPEVIYIPVNGELLKFAHPYYPFDYESLTNYNFTNKNLIVV